MGNVFLLSWPVLEKCFTKLFENRYKHSVKMVNWYVFINKFTHDLLTSKGKANTKSILGRWPWLPNPIHKCEIMTNTVLTVNGHHSLKLSQYHNYCVMLCLWASLLLSLWIIIHFSHFLDYSDTGFFLMISLFQWWYFYFVLNLLDFSHL